MAAFGVLKLVGIGDNELAKWRTLFVRPNLSALLGAKLGDNHGYTKIKKPYYRQAAY